MRNIKNFLFPIIFLLLLGCEPEPTIKVINSKIQCIFIVDYTAYTTSDGFQGNFDLFDIEFTGEAVNGSSCIKVEAKTPIDHRLTRSGSVLTFNGGATDEFSVTLSGDSITNTVIGPFGIGACEYGFVLYGYIEPDKNRMFYTVEAQYSRDCLKDDGQLIDDLLDN